MPISILEREIYSETEAARLLRVPPSTLHYWLNGGTKRGKTYAPVIRTEPRDDRVVTWAEFIEAGLLREYRRELRVPMLELRSFIDRLRDGLGIPYPLAHAEPFVGDKQLVWDAQEEAGRSRFLSRRGGSRPACPYAAFSVIFLACELERGSGRRCLAAGQ